MARARLPPVPLLNSTWEQTHILEDAPVGVDDSPPFEAGDREVVELRHAREGSSTTSAVRSGGVPVTELRAGRVQGDRSPVASQSARALRDPPRPSAWSGSATPAQRSGSSILVLDGK